MNLPYLRLSSALLLCSTLSLASEPCEAPKNKSQVEELAACIGGPEGLQKLAVQVDGKMECLSSLEWAKDESWADKKLQIFYQLQEEPQKKLGEKMISALQKKEVDPRRLQFSQDVPCFPEGVATLEGRYSSPQLKASCGTFYPETDEVEGHVKTSVLNHLHLGKGAISCDQAVALENQKQREHAKKEAKVKDAEIGVLKAEKKALQAEKQLLKKQDQLRKARKNIGTASARDPKVSGATSDTPFQAPSAGSASEGTSDAANRASP